MNRVRIPFVALSAVLACVAACTQAPPASKPAATGAPVTDAEVIARVNAFVDEWHADAAAARPAFFDKMAPEGIYIGTDRSERWTREELREWSRKYFARPSAWAFTPLVRHVALGPERRVAWFDEQLASGMGTLQSTGVLRAKGEGFEIVHYQLSMAVPNEVQPKVSEMIAAYQKSVAGGAGKPVVLESAALRDFATRYTAAWCSQDPAKVAAFFALEGSLTINAGRPAVGRAAVAVSARAFMTAFPDMVVALDRLERQGDRVEYHWTLTGTNTGPGGTGARVRISGYEDWRFGADGLLAESLGHYDASDYERQLKADRQVRGGAVE